MSSVLIHRHAICIIAHKNAEQINILLGMIDHPQIDIYIHLDSKSKIIPQKEILHPHYSRLFLVKQHDTRWGDISLIETEIELFSAVVKSKITYNRIHLISAQDMPVKSIDYILEYMDKEENRNKEFLSFAKNPDGIKRLKYYWLCTKHMRVGVGYKVIRHGALVIQKILGIDRLKSLPLEYKYGSEWASLTDGAVKYLVQNWSKYAKYFKYTVCCDELYKQMILFRGGYDFSSKGNLRYAKFVGASPEVISIDKIHNLVANPDILFARKFDLTLDHDAVDKLINEIKKREI